MKYQGVSHLFYFLSIFSWRFTYFIVQVQVQSNNLKAQAICTYSREHRKPDTKKISKIADAEKRKSLREIFCPGESLPFAEIFHDHRKNSPNESLLCLDGQVCCYSCSCWRVSVDFLCSTAKSRVCVICGEDLFREAAILPVYFAGERTTSLFLSNWI